MKMNNLFKETIFELFSFIKKFKFISKINKIFYYLLIYIKNKFKFKIILIR